MRRSKPVTLADAGIVLEMAAAAAEQPSPRSEAQWPIALRTPERVFKAPNATMRAAADSESPSLRSDFHQSPSLRSDFHQAQRSTETVLSPEGLFPRVPYELEVWYHMAAMTELLQAAEYPAAGVGIGVQRPYSIQRGPRYCPPPPEQAERMVAAGREWARRWVHGTVEARVADGVAAFAADEELQLWAHGWLRSRKGVSIHYRNWGAMTIGLLLGVEPGVLRWVGELYGAFMCRAGPEGGARHRPVLQLEGFTWCPRLATSEKTASKMRSAPAGSPAPDSLDPMSPALLASTYRIQERLVYEPDRRAYGTLEPGRAQPTTHLEFAANLARHDQTAAQADVQLVYSRHSHTLSCEERLARLLHFARHPPDLAEIERRCFGVEPRNDGVQRVWCSVSEAAVAAACRPALRRETPGHNLGTELTQSLGVALRRAGRHRTFNPCTSPLWVGPAARAELPVGRILGWPANLVHGWPNTNGLSSAYHITKTLCFASSYQEATHPQQAVWMHCWGLTDWAEVLGPKPVMHIGVPRGRICPSGQAGGSPKKCEGEGDQGPSAGRGRRRVAASLPAPEPALEPPARRKAAAQRKVHALGDVQVTPPAESDDPLDALLLRTAADLTHHATRLDTYSNLQAFAFMFKYVPETRIFFSLPHQLARALVLRFPETYPPATTDVLALAKRLLRERRDFDAPEPVQRMIRTLWDMFAPARWAEAAFA
jgi:hypothetical protein